MTKDTTALTLDDLRGTDRRSEPRIPRQRDIVILPCTTAAKWNFKTVQLCDCSRHGIAIISDTPVKRGDEFLAKLRVQRMTMVIYRVCHCDKLEDGHYRIGAKLVEFVGTPDEILKALLEETPAEEPETK